MAADESAVSGVTSSVTNLTADRVVDEHATDLPSYGARSGAGDGYVHRCRGEIQRAAVGEDTPTGGNAYAKLEGDDKLYTIISSTKASLNKSWKDLREKHLITFNSDKVSRVELDVPGKPPIEFGRADEQTGRSSESPGPCAPTVSRWNSLPAKSRRCCSIRKWKTKAAEGFAAAQPGVATVRVTGEEGLLSIEIRKNKEDVYAKSSQAQGICKVNKECRRRPGQETPRRFPQ